MRCSSTALSCALVLAPAAPAAAGDGGIFTSQTRRVTGSAFADDGLLPVSDSDSDEALDFGPFNVGASANAEIPDIALGTGGGTQDSTLLVDGCTAVGSAFATAESFDGKGSADGSGMSRFDVDFVITSASSFTLQGNIAAFDSGLTFVSLRDATNEIVGATVVGPASELPIDEFGTLPPGTYTLEIESSGNAFADFFSAEFAFAEYDLTLNVTALDAVPTVGEWGLIVLSGLLLCAGTLVIRGRVVAGTTLRTA